MLCGFTGSAVGMNVFEMNEAVVVGAGPGGPYTGAGVP